MLMLESRKPASRLDLRSSRVLAFAIAHLLFCSCDLTVERNPPNTVPDRTLAAETAPANDPARKLSEPPNIRFSPNRFFDKPDFVAALTDPVVTSSELAALDADSEVLGVYFDGQARAYSVQTLYKHHVINDQLGSKSVLLTYCGLCSSGTAFDATIDGERATFGVQGAWQGVATIYDQKTRSVWLHLTGECVRGKREGRRLKHLTVRHVLWSEWKRDHPTTTVVVGTPAAIYPSKRKARRGSAYFSPILKHTVELRDYRLQQNELLFGVAGVFEPKTGQELARAYPFLELKKVGPIVNEVIGVTPVVIVYTEKTNSAIGYSRNLDGETLEFDLHSSGQLIDKETDSIFNLDGVCVAGRRKGVRLRPIGVQAEWYGWYAHHPGTTIFYSRK